MKRNKNITFVIVIAILAVIILAACAAEQNHFRRDKSSDDEKQADNGQFLTAVYLQNDDGKQSLCKSGGGVSVYGDNT